VLPSLAAIEACGSDAAPAEPTAAPSDVDSDPALAPC